MSLAIPKAITATIPILSKSATNSSSRCLSFPVNRIYCIGRNYREHAIEMGHDPDREPPFFFMKPSDAVVDASSLSPSASCVIPYPPMTKSLHYEAELIIAIGKGGIRIPQEHAKDHIFGYAIGCDLTRRDLQSEAKSLKRPWATAKGFDYSAPMGYIVPIDNNDDSINEKDSNSNAKTAPSTIIPSDARISLSVNGEVKQDSTIDKMIWSIPEMISYLSTYFRLIPGDLIMTGTPSGVDDLHIGDYVEIACGNLPKCTFTIGEPE